MYDATEIFRTLPKHKKEGFIKLGFYLLSFFYYLYRGEVQPPSVEICAHELAVCALLTMSGYSMVLFADLEADYINPYDFCTRANSLLKPEWLGHAFLTCISLLTGEWGMLVLNMLLVCYYVYRLVTGTHLYYATDAIKTLDARRQESNVRFGFYLVCFFYYAYRVADIPPRDPLVGWVDVHVGILHFCNKMNQFVLPEAIAHATLTLVFLLSGQWRAVALNVPLVIVNVNKIMKQSHMYDATEIFRTMGRQKNEVFFKLGFYLISFFFYLYCMIVALIAEDEAASK
ncbi:hypothetical protein NM688_g7940 [Phlebia brevispora]|uniref:Uncharacterized protein n=1 Tax=Phlebia brevispora TaxID=194682 RepID=A0ACC1RZB9_9APHY|nr:hypothetical protein NM688_g7940 [Phlebia brevispora]